MHPCSSEIPHHYPKQGWIPKILWQDAANTILLRLTPIRSSQIYRRSAHCLDHGMGWKPYLWLLLKSLQHPSLQRLQVPRALVLHGVLLRLEQHQPTDTAQGTVRGFPRYRADMNHTAPRYFLFTLSCPAPFQQLWRLHIQASLVQLGFGLGLCETGFRLHNQNNL